MGGGGGLGGGLILIGAETLVWMEIVSVLKCFFKAKI